MNVRSGFTLAELVVSIALLAVIGGAIHSGLSRQQKLFRSIALMVGTRSDVRDAGEVLAADLHSASPLDTLQVARDSAAEFLGSIGVTLSCDSAPGYTLRIPPEKLASGLQLTSLLASPDTNDLILAYNDDSAATGGKPRWDRHTIASVASQSAGSSCPAFTPLEDGAAPALVFTLRGAASPGVRRGAPVRVLRRIRYSLYRSSDSRWYLGHRRCNPLGPSSCVSVQPVSGPYSAYAAAGGSGVTFKYFDAEGAALEAWGAGSRVSRVHVFVKGRSQVLPWFGRAPYGVYSDSSAASVALRNRD